MNVRDFPVMVSTRLVTLISGFLATLLLIQGLSQTSYGTFVFWISLLTFTKMLFDGSLTPFTKYILPQIESERIRSAITTGMIVKLASGILGGLMLLGYFAVQQKSNTWLFIGIFTAFLLVTVFDFLIGVLTGLKSFKSLAAAEIVNSLSKLGIYAVIIAVAAQPVVVLGGFATAYALGLAVALVVTIRKTRGVSETKLRANYDEIIGEFRTFAPYQFLNSIVKTAGGPVLVWILAWLLGPIAVAQWGAILQMERLLTRLLHPVREVLFPEFSGSTETLRISLTTNYIKICTVVLLPIIVGGMVLAPILLETVFGPAYKDASPAFVAIIWAAFFGALGGLPYFQGQGRTRIRLFISIVNHVILLGLFTAGAYFSFNTAVYGYLAAMILSTGILYVVIFKEQGLPDLSKFAPVRTLALLVIFASATITVEPYLENPITLAGAILALGTGYFVLMFRLRIITDYEKRLLIESAPSHSLRKLLDIMIYPQSG